jgi:molybdopterin biosynthesis enzyme MoaB
MKHSDGFKIGVLTLSDKGSRGERVDESGQVIKEMVADFGHVTKYCVLPDDLEAIARNRIN